MKTKDGAVGRENGSKRKREREKENFPHQPAENRNDGVPHKHPPLCIFSIAAGHPLYIFSHSNCHLHQDLFKLSGGFFPLVIMLILVGTWVEQGYMLLAAGC